MSFITPLSSIFLYVNLNSVMVYFLDEVETTEDTQYIRMSRQEGIVRKGHTVLSINGIDSYSDCVIACLEEPKCGSINYQDTAKTCILNDDIPYNLTDLATEPESTHGIVREVNRVCISIINI